MIIVRAPRRAQFEVLPHGLLRDSSLSYRARGIACRLLSNIDGYQMSSADLAGESPREGRYAVLAALRELRDRGYISWKRQRAERGRWVTIVTISDTPTPASEVQPLHSGHLAGVQPPDSGRPNPGGPESGALHAKSTRPRITKTITSTTAVADLVWPIGLNEDERVVVVQRYFEGLAANAAQDVLDELQGRIQLNRPPQATMAWLKGAADAAQRGKFVLDAGRAVQAARTRAAAEAEQKRLQVGATAARHDPDARARADAAARRAAAAAAEIGILPLSSLPSKKGESDA